MCEILDSFMERGVSKGENMLAKLMESLFRDNRLEEARLASTDAEARRRLYKEYGLA